MRCDPLSQWVSGLRATMTWSSSMFFVVCGVALVAAQCGRDQFRCRDGRCIVQNLQCNGQRDCNDWSDETLTLCRGVSRSFFNIVFMCGNKNVRDTLDDVCPTTCSANPVDCGLALFANTVKAPTTANRAARSCDYPTSFPNGRVSVHGEIDLVNMTASHGSDLRFSCNSRFELVGKSKVYCQFGNWSEPFPTCVRSSLDRCILPRQPDRGQYIAPGKNNPRPGDHFEEAYLYFSCDEGYRLLGGNVVMCHHGNWTSRFPTCQKLCKLNPHVSVEYSCMITENHVTIGSRPCTQFEPEGTVVSPQCRSPNYYHPGVLNNMHCIDGNWDYVAVCDPECGKVTPNGVKLEIGARPALLGELPWHAGIYDKRFTPYMQKCGGSLVSSTMVITAAHCFWDDATQALFPSSNFAVALGKIYRPWNDAHDTSRQRFDIQDIKITPRFRGVSTLYQEDIALVMMAAPAIYQNNVRPVCLDFDANFDRRQLEDGNQGKVAGWGLTTANGTYAKILQVLELPMVSIATCIAQAPVDFRPYITSDKFCAGYYNGSKALCMGDSGGGLAFAEHERETERYYLRGVVSTAASAPDTACNAQAATTFTQISRHEQFIKQYLVL